MDFAVTDAEWSAIIETNFQAACVFFGPLFAADGNGGLGAYHFYLQRIGDECPGGNYPEGGLSPFLCHPLG